MFKIILAFKRKAGLTRDEFIEHYERRHVPLAHRIMPPLEEYRRNYIVSDDPLRIAIGDGRAVEEAPFDVITEAIHATRAGDDGRLVRRRNRPADHGRRSEVRRAGKYKLLHCRSTSIRDSVDMK